MVEIPLAGVRGYDVLQLRIEEGKPSATEPDGMWTVGFAIDPPTLGAVQGEVRCARRGSRCGSGLSTPRRRRGSTRSSPAAPRARKEWAAAGSFRACTGCPSPPAPTAPCCSRRGHERPALRHAPQRHAAARVTVHQRHHATHRCRWRESPAGARTGPGPCAATGPQIATLLAAVRLRDDVPPELYAALAAVLGTLLQATTDWTFSASRQAAPSTQHLACTSGRNRWGNGAAMSLASLSRAIWSADSATDVVHPGSPRTVQRCVPPWIGMTAGAVLASSQAR